MPKPPPSREFVHAIWTEYKEALAEPLHGIADLLEKLHIGLTVPRNLISEMRSGPPEYSISWDAPITVSQKIIANLDVGVTPSTRRGRKARFLIWAELPRRKGARDWMLASAASPAFSPETHPLVIESAWEHIMLERVWNQFVNELEERLRKDLGPKEWWPGKGHYG